MNNQIKEDEREYLSDESVPNDQNSSDIRDDPETKSDIEIQISEASKNEYDQNDQSKHLSINLDIKTDEGS